MKKIKDFKDAKVELKDPQLLKVQGGTRWQIKQETQTKISEM